MSPVTSTRRPLRSLLAAAVSLAAIASGVLGSTSAPATAAVSAPTFLGQVGHPGHAGVYAWGMATATDGTILVGDYWNYNIKRYSTSGTLLQTISSRGREPGQNMGPHGIAVDPTDGSIYMADQNFTWKIHKWAADGTYIRSIDTYKYGVTVPYPYVTRVQVLSDGTLLALSSHNIPSLEGFSHRVMSFAPDGTFLGSWGVNGSEPGQLGLQRGFAVGPDDEVYLGDATKGLIQVFTKDGAYLRSIGAGRFHGDMRGLAVDFDKQVLYAVDAFDSQIEKFALDGTWLKTWGSEGTGVGQFRDGGREITVGQDHRVYVADYGNNRVNVYNPDGTGATFFPNPAPQPPLGGFNQPQDVAVSADGSNIYVADTYNHRIQRFGSDFEPISTWGFRGSTDPFAMNYPRGLAVHKDGSVFVMNSREGNLKVYGPTGSFKRQLLSWGADPGQTNMARGVVVGPDGTIYIADGNNLRLQALDAQGAPLWQVPCGISAPKGSINLLKGCSGLDLDSAGNVYAASYQEHVVRKFSPTGQLLATFGLGKGSTAGYLRSPYDVAVYNGRVYVSESNNRRVSIWSLDGEWIGKFGRKGEADGEFMQPRGIDIDANGKVYVVDGILERVSVFQL